MISGEIVDQLDGTYKINLNNGQVLSLEKECIPESLRINKKKVNLIFGGDEEGSVDLKEARELVNNLLGLK